MGRVKRPISYIFQTKEDSVYPAHLHTNKIVQTISKLSKVQLDII